MDGAKTDFTMRQASAQLGVSVQVLRKYCNNGLVPGLRYTPGRQRIFTVEQLDWLRVMVMLSRAKFTVKDLRRYLRLGQTGTSEAVQEQRAMLQTHKRQVWQELEDLQAAIDFIERQEEVLETGAH